MNAEVKHGLASKTMLIAVFLPMVCLTLSFMASTVFLRAQVATSTVDRFYRGDMQQWLVEFSEKNPTIIVPLLHR